MATRTKGITARLRAARKRKKDAAYREARQVVYARDFGKCRHCGLPSGFESGHAHHIRFRSQGGSHDPSNLAWLCSACHERIHLRTLVVTGNANAELEFTEKSA